MTWLGGWAVTGGTNSAEEARLMLQASTRAGQGVVEVGDLKVSATSTPSSSVRIAAGACVIKGVEVTGQGSYSGVNLGVDTLSVPAAGASPAHHLIVARAEDPTFSGSPWDTDLLAGEPVVRAVLIPNVAAGTTKVPAGMSGIPLARIDLPASTAAVTNFMINDLRQMIDPRSQRVLRVSVGSVAGDDRAGNVTSDYEHWPQAGWTVDVPTWATQVQVVATWGNVLLEPTGSTGAGSDARGQLRVLLDTGSGTTVSTVASSYNVNQVSTSNGYRTSLFNADQRAIPAAMRGKEVTVHMQAQGASGYNGRLLADAYGNFAVDLMFLELPAPEAVAVPE
ncbi:hypothetical protein [Streptomyces sp. MJP52]|uniref:hypothetical protein n=1 Tax=Streptomyces sp. MJP52 TaxID=2940555 RepID=UPI002475F608|nr:hypothetical protein [Streptomyces sp. MJP52]MDH6226202.1 hypothetical protein [Streptomyces sp. MJP52]